MFFDLVFVFGFTQVTTVLSRNPTWSGLGHGLLILATLWWAWTAYAWLTNTVDPDVGVLWGAMLVAMGAMFVAALAVPDAFGRHGVVFGIAFLIVNVMHLALYALAARGDRNLLAAIFRYAPGALSGAALILAAGFVDGGLKPVLWLAALAIGLFGPLFGGVERLEHPPAHFVERHGLIVIIAIGESLIAIGLGERLSGLERRRDRRGRARVRRRDIVLAGVLRLLPDPCRAAARRPKRPGRTALARDVYSYLHLPMVAGIVLFAFAMKSTLAHVDKHSTRSRRSRSASAPPSTCSPSSQSATGVAHARPRPPDRRARLRPAVPVALVVSALVALALVTAVWVATPRLRADLVARRARQHAHSICRPQPP